MERIMDLQLKKVIAGAGLEAFEKFEKKLKQFHMMVAPQEKASKVEIKPERTSLFYFSRYSGFREALEYGENENNHFEIALNQIHRLNSAYANDRWIGVDQ